MRRKGHRPIISRLDLSRSRLELPPRGRSESAPTVGSADGKDAETLNAPRIASHIGHGSGICWLFATAWSPVAVRHVVLTLIGVALIGLRAWAGIQLPVADPSNPIRIDGENAVHWQEGTAEVWVIHNGTIRQGQVTARAEQVVMWMIQEGSDNTARHVAIVYLEGSADVDFARSGPVNAATEKRAQSIRDHTWFGRFTSDWDIEVRAPVNAESPYTKPAVYEHAQTAWQQASGPVQPAQLTQPEPIGPPPMASLSGGYKRVQVGPRSNALYNVKSFPGTIPNQSVTVFSNGIRAIVEGVEAPQLGHLGRIVIETDRLVLWGPNLKKLSPAGSEAEGDAAVPIELYMEGNIVFRQGDRLIYADRMYYNATQEYGVVLSAEMVTPVPDYEGIIRLKADVLQQLNRQFFRAYGAATTSSQMGVPKYWLQTQNFDLRDEQTPRTDPITGQMTFDPRTGEAAVNHDWLATSRNSFVYVGGFPILYWPVMSTNLRDPELYIKGISFRSDDILGTQVRTRWNALQLFGIRRKLDGTKWTVATDWLSKRGLGLGTNLSYERPNLFGFPGSAHGVLDAWGVYDDGLDTLGADRVKMVPETKSRGRLLWWHRHDLGGGYQFTAEAGVISDRNFLEQFYEQEWDERKDQVTRIELMNLHEEQSLGLSASVRLNDFFTQSEWLPRLDHFLIGRSLLQDHLTWFAHSDVGYARLKTASAPTDPQDAAGWHLLPWEQNVEGARAVTRQEIDLPVQLGWFKFVPYASGEAGFWEETLNGQKNTSRFVGQAGLRASIPFWKAYPTVQNTLFNLNGMAHKTTLLGDLFWADASKDFDQFPLYDEVDDDSQQHFRRRLVPNGLLYDERFYLIRSGLQSWVSSPSAELADDLIVLRTGLQQRWQTKRGLPGHEHIIDWITFNVNASFYPKPDRDNFGESMGQLDYLFRWHIGDRLTLLSDGYADPFAGGLRMMSLGGAITREDQGRLFAKFISMDGPFTSNLLVAALSYRMSEKWVGDLSGTYDFGPTGQIGERFGLTRIGESFLVRIGFYADHGRDNVGASLSIEPRFLPHNRLSRLAGLQIPPLGSEGLE